MQFQHQRPRHGQHNNIRQEIQRRVNVVHGVFVHAVAGAIVPPIGRDGRTLEDGRVEEDDPPAEDEGGDAVGYEAEAAAGEEAVVEEEDGEFDEGEGADVDDLEGVDGLVEVRPKVSSTVKREVYQSKRR